MIGLLGFLAIWGAARYFRLPNRKCLGLMAGWMLVLLLVTAPQLGFDAGARIVGGHFQSWVVFALLSGLVLFYRQGLKEIRSRVRPAVEAGDGGAGPAQGTGLKPAEVERYARHLYLREIGGQGQQRLKAARVLVIGAGGLGAPALLYLAGAGVGTIGVIDDDQVEATNLQRQIIHKEEEIGVAKVRSAYSAMRALNRHVTIRPYKRRLTEENAAALFEDYDLILDGTDNFDTRYLVNRTCAALGKPLIAGALGQWEGQLSLYDPARGEACYECVFPERPAAGLVPSCAEAGVVAALPGVIGSMMAMEAIKYLTGAGETLRGRLMIHDALYAETRVIRTKARKDCEACGHLQG